MEVACIVDRFEVVVKKRTKRRGTRCLSKALDDEGHFWEGGAIGCEWL